MSKHIDEWWHKRRWFFYFFFHFFFFFFLSIFLYFPSEEKFSYSLLCLHPSTTSPWNLIWILTLTTSGSFLFQFGASQTKSHPKRHEEAAIDEWLAIVNHMYRQDQLKRFSSPFISPRSMLQYSSDMICEPFFKNVKVRLFLFVSTLFVLFFVSQCQSHILSNSQRWAFEWKTKRLCKWHCVASCTLTTL